MHFQPTIDEDDPYRAHMQKRFLGLVRATASKFTPHVLDENFVFNNEPVSENMLIDEVFKAMHLEKRHAYDDEYYEDYNLEVIGDRWIQGTLAFWHHDINNTRREKLLEFDNKTMFPMITNLVKTERNLLTRPAFTKLRIPFAKQLMKKLNCKPNELYDRIKTWKLGNHLTVEQWYNHYEDRYKQHLGSTIMETHSIDLAETVSNQDIDIPVIQGKPSSDKHTNKSTSKYAFKPVVPVRVPSSKPHKPPSKPGKPDKQPRVDSRPVVSKDAIPYPFKSKLSKYKKEHPDVEYTEVPEQPKVQYKLLHRPYFSSTIGAWEIDHCFDMLEEGDAWLFCVTVNTRYLVVYMCEHHKGHKENADETYDQLKNFIKKYKPNSIRGDGSNAYANPNYMNRVYTPAELRKDFYDLKIATNSKTHKLMQLYMNNNITIYFNSSAFTLHNKIVDVTIKTIRNAIGYRKLKPEHMYQLIDYYNDTVHKSIGCTPTFMQENPDVEYQYIRWCEKRLGEVIANQKLLGYLDYKPGNVLMVHIDTGKTSEKHKKRRRFFDRLGTFVQYDHGNVVVDMIVQDVRVHSSGKKKHQVIVPIYHTKYVAKNIRSLPAQYRDYYITSMTEFSVDDSTL